MVMMVLSVAVTTRTDIYLALSMHKMPLLSDFVYINLFNLPNNSVRYILWLSPFFSILENEETGQSMGGNVEERTIMLFDASMPLDASITPSIRISNYHFHLLNLYLVFQINAKTKLFFAKLS